MRWERGVSKINTLLHKPYLHFYLVKVSTKGAGGQKYPKICSRSLWTAPIAWRLEFSVTTLMSNHAIKRSLEPPQGSTQPLSRLTKNVRNHFLHRIFPSLIGTNPSFVAPKCLLNWGKKTTSSLIINSNGNHEIYALFHTYILKRIIIKIQLLDVFIIKLTNVSSNTFL